MHQWGLNLFKNTIIKTSGIWCIWSLLFSSRECGRISDIKNVLDNIRGGVRNVSFLEIYDS